jgi:hypothetical protein
MLYVILMGSIFGLLGSVAVALALSTLGANLWIEREGVRRLTTDIGLYLLVLCFVCQIIGFAGWSLGFP